jgi:tetratricopeptide (TPR) repeat protein
MKEKQPMDSLDNLDPAAQRRLASQLEDGITLARRGDLDGARTVFRRIIHNAPYAEDPWLWLAWVAETRQESLRYLQEAQALLPESPRIQEALRWAKEEIGKQAPAFAEGEGSAAEAGPSASQADASSKATRIAASARQAAQAAQQNAAQAFARLKADAPGMERMRPVLQRLGAMAVPALWVAATIALLLLVMTAIANGKRSHVVQAAMLPTPVADATSTPTINQRTRSLWVQVDVAWTREDWSAAIDALERIRVADPHNDDARRRLAEACYGQAMKLIQSNRLDEAQAQIDAAIRLDAGSQELQEVRRLLRMYLDGVDAYWRQDWKHVVDRLRKVYEANPAFRDTQVMLGQAYYKLGIERQESEVWEESRDAYLTALQLLPDLTDARVRLNQVLAIITPPRRIEADLSTFLITVYEDNKPIKVFKCCTGRGNSPTLPGRYEVLDKLPNAYASKWDLQMPWWLGIYWAGGSENGIHALPILSNGQTLWAGYLGKQCSFGCIVLDTPDARWLYDWAQVGTVVFVNP